MSAVYGAAVANRLHDDDALPRVEFTNDAVVSHAITPQTEFVVAQRLTERPRPMSLIRLVIPQPVPTQCRHPVLSHSSGRSSRRTALVPASPICYMLPVALTTWPIRARRFSDAVVAELVDALA
jgi:hypothetical protein